jgi:hypothetical protein
LSTLFETTFWNAIEPAHEQDPLLRQLSDCLFEIYVTPFERVVEFRVTDGETFDISVKSDVTSAQLTEMVVDRFCGISVDEIQFIRKARRFSVETVLEEREELVYIVFHSQMFLDFQIGAKRRSWIVHEGVLVSEFEKTLLEIFHEKNVQVLWDDGLWSRFTLLF